MKIQLLPSMPLPSRATPLHLPTKGTHPLLPPPAVSIQNACDTPSRAFPTTNSQHRTSTPAPSVGSHRAYLSHRAYTHHTHPKDSHHKYYVHYICDIYLLRIIPTTQCICHMWCVLTPVNLSHTVCIRHTVWASLGQGLAIPQHVPPPEYTIPHATYS